MLLQTDFSYFATDEEVTFVHPDDVALHEEWNNRAFELQVANHELLGHGTGKLFTENADGTKNFDPAKVRILMTCFYFVCSQVA